MFDLFGAPVVAMEPEADTPRELPPLPTLYGHAQALDDLIAAIHAGRAPHSLILHGREGIGKGTFLMQLACRLYNLPYPNADDTAGMWAQMAHPDLLVVERGFDDRKNMRRDDILQDDVKPIAPFLRKTAARGGIRLVIIDDASAMADRAQNVILKILEEPPAGSMIILNTHAMGRLIPTIRSRCQVLELAPLSSADMESYLHAHGAQIPAVHRGLVLSFAGGAPGLALRLLEGGDNGAEVMDGVFTLLNTTRDASPLTRFEMGEKLAARADTGALFDLVDHVLGCVILALAGEPQALAPFVNSLAPKTRAAFEGAGIKPLLALRSALAAHRASCENQFLDKKYAVHGAIRLLAEG